MRSIANAIVDWSVHKKLRKRKQRKEKWQDQTRAAWIARLPADRSTCEPLELADVDTQQDSLFFTKLPTEIRRIIYRYAVDGGRLHLKLIDEEKAPLRLKCLDAQALVDFSRSCKIAYRETLPFVYTENTFYVPGTTTFFGLQRSVSKVYFQQIRSMHLRWDYAEAREMFDFLDGVPPYDCETWKHVCGELETMRGLKKLRIDLRVNAPYVKAAYEELLLSPLVPVNDTTEDFEVHALWDKRTDRGDREEDWKAWPFKLQRGLSTEGHQSEMESSRA